MEYSVHFWTYIRYSYLHFTFIKFIYIAFNRSITYVFLSLHFLICWISAIYRFLIFNCIKLCICLCLQQEFSNRIFNFYGDTCKHYYSFLNKYLVFTITHTNIIFMNDTRFLLHFQLYLKHYLHKYVWNINILLIIRYKIEIYFLINVK